MDVPTKGVHVEQSVIKVRQGDRKGMIVLVDGAPMLVEMAAREARKCPARVYGEYRAVVAGKRSPVFGEFRMEMN